MAGDPSLSEQEQEEEETQIKADAEFVQHSSSASGSAKQSGTVEVESAQVSPKGRVRSARGVALFYLVNEGPHSPETVSNDTSISTSQAGHALDELYDRELVELLLPGDAPDGPVYGVVPRGGQAAYYILDNE